MTFSKFNMFVVIIILGIMSILFSLIKGSISIDLIDLFHAFTDQRNPLVQQIFLTLRLPRTLSAFITGGLLAIAGVIMQILLRNPLADPYVLGVSSGAALASLLCLFFGFSGYWLTGAAWIGSLCVMTIILFMNKKSKNWDKENVLLTGIALTSGFSALISFILIISTKNDLHSMLFWLLGDLNYAHTPYLEGIILIIGLFFCLIFAKQLNVLTLGNIQAQCLGVEIQKLHRKLFILSSILTATAVALAGCIGFVGLIVPHFLRLLVGYDHKWLIPSCLIAGGTLLTFADTVSRSLFAPQQLPVGMVMAFIGIPIFVGLLHKKNK